LIAAAPSFALPDDPRYQPRWVSPVRPWVNCDKPRRLDLRDAWTAGDISHHLTPSQQTTYAKYRAWSALHQAGRVFMLDCSRRWGKSALGCVTLIEDCFRIPGGRFVYLGPEKEQIKKFVIGLMENVLSDCPPDLRPRFYRTSLVYEFRHNGSRIELYGLDKNPDGGRGPGLDGGFLDEAAFFKRLEYTLKDVLLPQMMGRLWARLLGASTPPVSPGHTWTAEMLPDAMKRGALDQKTILDADQYSEAERDEIIESLGGRNSSRCKRELFCIHEADASRAIIPEYQAVEKEIVTEFEIPLWRDCYTAMDPGWQDLTGVLFGYWNFDLAKLDIEDEIAESQMVSGKIAEEIKRKEALLWPPETCKRLKSDGSMVPQPYRRYSDRNRRLLGDLSREHDLVFIPTRSDDIEQDINQLRNAIAQKKIRIHPRCVMLQQHLRNGVWKNDRHNIFDREGKTMGHFDLISALNYMWRNVNRHRNPAPKVVQTYDSDRRARLTGHADTRVSKWDRGGKRQFMR
jgi:hypothetical protein